MEKLSPNLRKLCLSTMALLMVASTGADIASNIPSANASRRRTHYTRRVNKRRPSKRTNKRTKRIKRTKRTNSRKKVAKAPWKKSWNKYAATNVIATIPNKLGIKDMTRRNRDIGPIQSARKSSANSHVTWNQFFKDHQSKNSFTNHIVSYPSYSQLFEANNNMYYENRGKSWDINFPDAYTLDHVSGKTVRTENLTNKRNYEVLGNLPLHNFTKPMRDAFRNVAVPATNGQRVLTSFHHMMRSSRNHPSIMIGSHKYTYNPKSTVFTDAYGTNGYGKTYRFNPKTNKYRLVSSKNVDNKINNERKNVEAELNKNSNNMMNQIKNNPSINYTTKEFLKYAAQNPNNSAKNNISTLNKSQNLANAYKQTAQNPSVPKSQQAKVAYMAKTLNNQQKSTVKATNQISPQVRQDLMTLQANGAFNGMNDEQKASFVQKLLTVPGAMDQALAKYKANNTMAVTNQPTQLAKAADNYADAHSSIKVSNNNGVITNDPKLSRDATLLKDDIIKLAQQQGIKLPNTLSVSIHF